MTTRGIWEALSIGKVSQLITPEAVNSVTILFIIVIIIQTAIGLGYNYIDNRYSYNRVDTSTIWRSMYCLFYLPILVLAASFEALLVIQMSFTETGFYFTIIAIAIGKIIMFFYMIDEEKLPSPFGIMRSAQRIGLLITSKKKLFFEDTILQWQAIYNIKQKQRKAK